MTVAVLPKASKYPAPRDGKTKLGYAFWNFVNELIIVHQFKKFEVVGAENIPTEGAFLLIANHSRRWDGPVVQYLLNRRANYMVSPNEMKGLQGAAVMSVGAFPANPRLDPIGYAVKQLRADEPVVVFPEGNVFYDGEVHPFKPGVAKIAMNAASAGHPIPVIPMYISYGGGKVPSSVKLTVGKPIALDDYISRDRFSSGNAGSEAASREISGNTNRIEHREISQLLYDEVIALRDGKVANGDSKPRPDDDKETLVQLQCSA